MKKVVLVFFIFTFSIACSKKKEATIDKKATKEIIVNQPKKQVVLGNDEDSHGCKTTSGYTWSEIKKECVRIFEIGIRLDSSQKDTMSAFIIFDDNENKVELFTILEKTPIILNRNSNNHSWTNGEWKLVFEKKFILKKGDSILFIGKKIAR